LQVERRLIVALDFPAAAPALDLAGRLTGRVGLFKVGLELFCAAGPAVVPQIAAKAAVFLDLKLHDIPHTVAGAVRSLMPLAPAVLDVHAAGGLAMMRAAREAADDGAARLGRPAPRLVAVTVLTALDQEAFQQAGFTGPIEDTVLRLAHLAARAGLDGVVASAGEAPAIRREMGSDFLIIAPGIRPPGAAAGDQRRLFSPAEAIRAGVSHLVVGRPVTKAPDPGRAVQDILEEMAKANSGHGTGWLG